MGVFLRELINASVIYSKESKEEWKKAQNNQKRRLTQIAGAAEKLARLLKESDELGILNGCHPIGLNDPFSLLAEAVKNIESSEYATEQTAGAFYCHGINPEIEKIPCIYQFYPPPIGW